MKHIQDISEWSGVMMDGHTSDIMAGQEEQVTARVT